MSFTYVINWEVAVAAMEVWVSPRLIGMKDKDSEGYFHLF